MLLKNKTCKKVTGTWFIYILSKMFLFINLLKCIDFKWKHFSVLSRLLRGRFNMSHSLRMLYTLSDSVIYERMATSPLPYIK